MENKKKTTQVKKTSTKKNTAKVQTKKNNTKKSKKAFTLIELLAVIIILGVLMIIAIPSVTRYIQDSRKNAYITTAHNFIDSARVMANSGELSMYDPNTTYYIPKDCISLEKGGDSPFGEFTDAYVVVTYNGKGYDYYWTSNDVTHNGIYLTYEGLLDVDSVMSDVESISPNIGVGDRENIIVFDEGTCNTVKTESTAIDTIEEQDQLSADSINAVGVNFSTDSWETIIAAVKRDKISAYKVGDTKTVDLGKYGTHTLRIANKSTPAECSTSGFSQTACGFVLEFTDIITSHVMNSINSNEGGWPATDMRKFLNDENNSDSIISNLPKELQKGIINTFVVSSHGWPWSLPNFTSTDKLYLLSDHEVYTDDLVNKSNPTSSTDTSYYQTRQLDYYADLNITRYNCSEAIKRYNSSNKGWWLRSAYPESSYSFSSVGLECYSKVGSSQNPTGVSPAFRIG